MDTIDIYRNGSVNVTLKMTRDIVFTHALMSEHKITFSSYRTPHIIDIQIGDYLFYRGVKYKINTIPNYSKIEHTTEHEYNFALEAPIYGMYDKSFRFEGQSEFPFFGTLDDFATHLISQMNEIDPGWTKGEIAETPEKHIPFDGVSCRVALTQGAEEYGAEFFFDGDGKRLNMVIQVGVDRDITLSYGKGNGLYNLTRTYVQEKNVVTRVYGTGGARNLPIGYPFSRLQLPAPLEANIDLYGIKEGEYRNEDIFPTRTGIVSSVVAYNPETKFNKLTDIDLDFDINQYHDPTKTWKVGFQDGELAGEEFEITSYDHATRTITYLTNADTSIGQVLPNENLSAKSGDKYKLFDIILPQSYLDAAIAELATETAAHLDQKKFPQAAYDLNIDVLHFKRNGYQLEPGDRIRVIDEDIHLDEKIRVISVSYPIAFPDHLWTGMSFSAEIANNFIPYTVQERIIIEQKEAKKAIKDQSKLSKHTQAALEEIARAAAIQQFERTYIGELAILTGAMLVGNPSLGAVAGISGLEDTLEAIRFFAGSDFENRGDAPFRVNQKGEAWMENAFIKGVIEAVSGKIGNWEITDGGLVNNDGSAYIIARDTLPGGKEATAIIGTNALPTESGLRAIGLFKNTSQDPLYPITNYGLLIDVQNGFRNIGISSNASIVGQGFVDSRSLHIFTPTSGDNTLNPARGINISCHITNALFKDVYLPAHEYIIAMLGINGTTDYCIQINVTNQFNSSSNMILRAITTEGWSIKRVDAEGAFVSVDNMDFAIGRSATFNIYKSGLNRWIHQIV